LGWLLIGQPAADGLVQGVGVDAGQHATHGGLAWWPPPGAAGRGAPERGQYLVGRVACPLTDGGKRSGAGQHRGHRHSQHRGQRVPSAASVAGIGELGEVVEQTAVLVGRQRGGRGQPIGNRGNGR
jgi:hypothetical protein